MPGITLDSTSAEKEIESDVESPNVKFPLIVQSFENDTLPPTSKFSPMCKFSPIPTPPVTTSEPVVVLDAEVPLAKVAVDSIFEKNP